MVTKAQLQAELEHTQQQLAELQAQQQAKPVTVTLRVPLQLREQMKITSRIEGLSMQEWTVKVVTAAVAGSK